MFAQVCLPCGQSLQYGKCPKISNTLKFRTSSIFAQNNFWKCESHRKTKISNSGQGLDYAQAIGGRHDKYFAKSVYLTTTYVLLLYLRRFSWDCSDMPPGDHTQFWDGIISGIDYKKYICENTENATVTFPFPA